MKKFDKTVDKHTNIVYNLGMKDKKERHNIAITNETWKIANANAQTLGLSVSAYLTMLVKKDNLS